MRDTIKKYTDFMTPEDGPVAKSSFFVIRLGPTKTPGTPRYGLKVTKRVFKFAVHRNRAKRLLRDWIRYNDKLLLPEYDYIFISRTGILGAGRDEGREAMRKALAYLKKQYGTKK
ncbi:MAG: ribonuclease P protein component [Alphaproteobacteria bacterium]